MISNLVEYVLYVWGLMYEILDNIDIGGISVIDIIVVSSILSICVGIFFNKKE